MPAFPTWVQVVPLDSAEQMKPVVLRSEMERSIPKQRRIAADTLGTLPVTAVFQNAQRATEFEDWFFNEAGAGAAFFDWVHPRTGATVQARIVGGDIGQLRPLGSRPNSRYARSFQVEYVRSTLPAP
jgi:hypothetical protein